MGIQDCKQDPDEQTEYPTSPSQIPFAQTGLLILHSAQLYAQAMSQKQPVLPSPELQTILELIDQQYESDARLRQSPPAIDSILALLYLVFCLPQGNTSDSAPPPPLTSIAPPTDTPLTRTDTIIESQTLLLATHTLLRDIFTTNPDLTIRDNAHHVASHLLHSHCQRDTRLRIIRTLLETDPSLAISPIHEAQSGNLKASGVDWLKDLSVGGPIKTQTQKRYLWGYCRTPMLISHSCTTFDEKRAGQKRSFD